jgi:hypothetical protein
VLERLLKIILDLVIDSTGGTIAQQVGRVLRQGGCIVIFEMTVAPQAPFTMHEVAEPAAYWSEQSCLPSLIYHFRLDDWLKGSPSERPR